MKYFFLISLKTHHIKEGAKCSCNMNLNKICISYHVLLFRGMIWADSENKEEIVQFLSL
jgi:hypothetical protein